MTANQASAPSGADDDLLHQLQSMGQPGGFDPMAMLIGAPRFQAVFLAPFSPSLTSARTRFLHDGTGPLADVVELFRRQGAADPLGQARAMLAGAVGMCVVVLAHDHGLSTIPQLFFGHYETVWRQQVVLACGEQFPAAPALARALDELAAQAQGGRTWPELVAGPEVGPAIDVSRRAFWRTLTTAVVRADADGPPSANAGGERLVDLAHWAATALATFPSPTLAETLAIARARMLAGEIVAAAGTVARLIDVPELEDEQLIELVQGFADCAIRAGQPEPAAAWFGAHLPRIEARTGPAYEAAAAWFRCLAASAAPADELLRAAAAMHERDRKAARHDLTREALWRVVVAPGELIDTAAAATRIARSPAFIAKRLEHGTIPSHRDGDQMRIPAAALDAWKRVMDGLGLLD